MRFTQVADVLRSSVLRTSDMNVPVVGWAVVRRRVPVIVQLEDRQTRPTDAGSVEASTHLVLARPNPPFTMNDRLLIAGLTYVVDALDPDVLARHHHSEARATVVTERS